jgi:hypothetical protein
MVEVIGHITRIAIVGLVRHMRENIPNGRPAPILPRSAFSLIRGRCAAPQKPLWKGAILGERFSFREPGQPDTGKRSRSPSDYPELTTIEHFHLSCLLLTLTNLLFMSRDIFILQSDIGMERCLKHILDRMFQNPVSNFELAE